MSAAAKAEDQVAFNFLAVLARGIDHHLLNLWLIDLKLAVFEQDIFPLGFFDLGHHLDIFTRTAVVHSTFLRISIVDDFLVLLPDEIGLRGTEVGGGRIHLFQNAFQAGGRLGLL